MPSDRRQQLRRQQRRTGRRAQRNASNRLWLILGTVAVVAIVGAIIASSVMANNNKKTTTQNTTTSNGHPNIDGIPCDPNEQVTYHQHAKLDIYVNGKHFTIPPFIGIPDSQPYCFYYLHTHDLASYAQGVIHIEYPAKPNPPPTIKDFLDIWTHTRSDDDAPAVKLLRGTVQVHAFVNRKAYSGNPLRIGITRHKLITIEIGKPVVPPPNYKFPSGV